MKNNLSSYKQRILVSKSKTNDGFSLVELLVVMAVIGMLLSIISVGLSSAKAKSRDARRLQDMKSLQSALEIYNNDNNGYPEGTSGNGWLLSSVSGLAPTYIAELPIDPNRTGTEGYRYHASGGTSGKRDAYALLIYLEVKNSYCRVTTEPSTGWTTEPFCSEL